MEDEGDQVDANPRAGVRISITRASFSEDESDLDLPEKHQRRPRSDSDASVDEEEMKKIMNEEQESENEQLENEKEASNILKKDSWDGNLDLESKSTEDEEVSTAFQNSVTISEPLERGDLNETGQSDGIQDNDKESSPSKGPAMEMIGDRVLIERDGKFELVDVKEIKAEYFEMLGISPEKSSENITDNEATPSETSEVNHDAVNELEEEKPPTRPRPKTTSVQELNRRMEKHRTAKRVEKNRSQSAQMARRKNDEYSHIKSVYAMTEQQLEIKRKRQEAIARRRKEEEEREKEENRRKREDAERAFQAWLLAKTEEAKEMQRIAKLNRPDPNVAVEKAEAARSAYDKWLVTKREQTKATKALENSRRADEASQYVIRDRELCDEAFKRWLKKKKEIARAKSAASKKKKPKLRRKEQPPHNSAKIRYYEYYGYRNNVVL